MQPVTQPTLETVAPPRLITPGAPRIASIDIFRGLTILVMVFVNDVSGVHGLPWWTYHMPGHANGMTYVDMVFPTFLFIVGLSMPLAFERRITRGDSKPMIWFHAVLRSLGLVVLGLTLANIEKIDPQLTGMNATLWSMLAFTAIFLVWNAYPRSERYHKVFLGLRGLGAVMLAVLLILFRRHTHEGQPAGLDFSYVEILGLIGWAYLSAAIVYLLLRTRKWALVASLVALSALNILCTARWLQLSRLPDYVWPFGSGALASIVMAGVIASMILVEARFAATLRSRALLLSGYALALFAAGLVFLPLGISKNQATPAWCLFCSAAAAMMLLGLYLVADVKGATKWAAFVKPAGSNTLLTYLLPWICGSIPIVGRLQRPWSSGAPGVVRALIFTGAILGLSAVLTRMKLRLQL
jgi:heparan-alpha-glucosaminide N-acetyltransferase